MDRLLKAIAEDIIGLFKQVLSSDVGINKKVGKNTLAQSRLYDTADAIVNNPFINVSVNDYITYINQGRKPRARLIPINALRDWASRKGIPNDNKTLNRIRWAIYRDGISPRPIETIFLDLLDKRFEEVYLDDIFNKITEKLDIYFNE